MSEIFNYDSIFIRLLNRLGDMLILSLIFILFSLPVFTIGASLTALYYTSMKAVAGDDGYILKNFVKSFKENFAQSTIMWLIFLLVFFVFGVDVWFWFNQVKGNGFVFSKPMLVLSVMLLLLSMMIFMYAFPLQSKFDNKISVQLRNAFLLSIRYFPTTLLLGLVAFVVAWAVYYFSVLAVIAMGLFGIGALACLKSYFMLRCFKPYLESAGEEADDYESEENQSEEK